MKEAIKKLAQSEMFVDEQEKKSFSRIWFSIWLANAIVMMWVDLLTGATISAAHQAIIGAGVLLLGGMAGGPRIMQYVGPQIGKVAAAIGQAKRDKRLPNPLTDDESDE